MRAIVTRRLVHAFDNWEATSKGQLWKVLTSHHGIRKVTCGIPISASLYQALRIVWSKLSVVLNAISSASANCAMRGVRVVGS